MKLDYQGNFNPSLFFEELLAANLAPVGLVRLEINPDNSEVFITLPDTVDKKLVDALVSAHDPTKLSLGQKISAVGLESKSDAQAITQWASWTEAGALAFIEQNVLDVGSAKAVLKDLARLVIALRNHTWPDLQQ